MHQMTARDHAVETDEQQPHRDDVRQDAHATSPARRSSTWSRNSVKISVIAPATSTPTATLNTGIVPPDSSEPSEPSGRKFAIAATPKTSPPTATRTNAAAPTPSAT